MSALLALKPSHLQFLNVSVDKETATNSMIPPYPWERHNNAPDASATIEEKVEWVLKFNEWEKNWKYFNNAVAFFSTDQKLTGWEVLTCCLEEAVEISDSKERYKAIENVYKNALAAGFPDDSSLHKNMIQLAMKLTSDPIDRKFEHFLLDSKDFLIELIDRMTPSDEVASFLKFALIGGGAGAAIGALCGSALIGAGIGAALFPTIIFIVYVIAKANGMP